MLCNFRVDTRALLEPYIILCYFLRRSSLVFVSRLLSTQSLPHNGRSARSEH